MKSRLWLGVLATTGLVFSASAKTTVWNGQGDGVTWEQAANWSDGAPVAGDDVTVKPSAAASIAIADADASVQSLALGGTWGATGSGAKHVDDVYFAGKGVLKVRGPVPLTLLIK